MLVCRSRFGLALALSACLLATACAPQAPAAPAAPQAPAATQASAAAQDSRKTQLSMMTWNYTGTMKAAYDDYITSFLAKEPRVTAVNIEAQPFVDYANVLNVKLSAKTPPNISWINASTGPLYVPSS